MMTTMQAIGSLPSSGGAGTDAGDVPNDEIQSLIISAHLNLITQLRLTGGMSEWAVYVALHLPGVGLRAVMVKELLSAHCPEWRSDDTKLEFLRGRLGLPQV